MSNIAIPKRIDRDQIANYERMIKTLLAAHRGNVDSMASYLDKTASSDPDPKKRRLAAELIQYVFDRKYLVNLA
jgi:hypothetical protein